MGFRSLISNDATVEHKLQGERDLTSRDTADVMDQTAPVVIKGMHGQRLLAYEVVSLTDPVDDLPKTYPHNRLPPQNSESAAMTEQKLVTDVSVHEFIRLDGAVFHIRGILLPPDPAPFTVAYLGQNKWLVRGGLWPFTEIDADGSNERVITQQIEDAVILLDEGYIVMKVVGRYLSSIAFQVTDTAVFAGVQTLDHDLTLSITGINGENVSRGGGQGMGVVAWVSTKRSARPIIFGRGNLNHLPPLPLSPAFPPETMFSSF